MVPATTTTPLPPAQEAGGSISPSGNVSAREDTDKTFTITPNSGYHISDVLVDGKSIGAVTSYTFEDVQEKHTIEAVFAKDNSDTGVYNPFTMFTRTIGSMKLLCSFTKIT